MDRNSPLREIKGVGAKTEELFHKIGVYTVGDILLHYPRTYIQYPQAKHVDEVLDGEQAAVLGRITRTPVVRKVRTMQITVTTISEMGASLELVWYRMPYMKNNLKEWKTCHGTGSNVYRRTVCFHGTGVFAGIHTDKWAFQ